MHPVLLIDEILRHIFLFCSEDDRPSLVAAAQACKAWKDPALDFIWERLSSLKPLLHLLSTFFMVDGEYVLIAEPSEQDWHRFNAYARRIKHVSNRHELKIHPSIAMTPLPFNTENSALPNLSTAHISLPRSAVSLMSLNFSPNLVRLEIDLGFKATSSSLNDALCEHLEQASKYCSELRHLSVRGHSSERLNKIISSMPHLESISLRLGSSLLPRTLDAIIRSPELLELEIHAGHVELNDIHEIHDINDVYDTYDTYTGPDHNIFSSLRKLHIRAKAALIENLLHYIQPNTLQHLDIELDDSSSCMTFWDTSFGSISNKAAHTLRHLSVDHHFEIIDASSSTSFNLDITSQTTGSLDISGISFQTMERLRNLKHLQHFSCDVTLPPSLNDQDLKKILTWWPDLQHFELGSSLPDEFEAVKSSHMTLACLSFFSNQAPKLRSLILPLVISDPLPLAPDVAQITKTCNLQNLVITRLETSEPAELARYLHCLFPSLRSLEGPCDNNQVWINTVSTLQTLVH